uniref:Thioredoxin domain-containing protein n=1 Tax=Piliocolobus tephrosceles TaxID=591936 RepID=A0A8C9LMM7_9PRIM
IGRLLGDVAPNFEANTTAGRIRFHDFLGNPWGVLSSHPRDFTPVCPTELGRAAKLAPAFAKRNVNLALSIDSVEDHLACSKDINAYNGKEPTEKLPFPIVDDKNWDLTMLMGMPDPAEKDEKDMPVAAPVVFVTGPDKKLKLSSTQLPLKRGVPPQLIERMGLVSWSFQPSLKRKPKKLFLKGVFTKELPSGKKYVHYTPQP